MTFKSLIDKLEDSNINYLVIEEKIPDTNIHTIMTVIDDEENNAVIQYKFTGYDNSEVFLISITRIEDTDLEKYLDSYAMPPVSNDMMRIVMNSYTVPTKRKEIDLPEFIVAK